MKGRRKNRNVEENCKGKAIRKAGMKMNKQKTRGKENRRKEEKGLGVKEMSGGMRQGKQR